MSFRSGYSIKISISLLFLSCCHVVPMRYDFNHIPDSLSMLHHLQSISRNYYFVT